ncbi:MAG: ABC-2 family transporter protein [Planctomycetaceae bacterium]
MNGYTFSGMVAYYLFAMLGRAFSSMPGLATGIARDVRDGTIKKYLTQPIDMLGYLFWHRVAHKLVYYIMAGAFYSGLLPFRKFLPGWPDAFTLCAFILSLIMAFMIGFLIEALIGMISFWFLEVSSLLFIYMMFNFFLSGHMIPLDWIPDPWGSWMKMLPLKYLAYFPAAIMLDNADGQPKYSHPELINELTIEAIWILILLFCNRLAYKWGTRRYGAFGG